MYKNSCTAGPRQCKIRIIYWYVNIYIKYSFVSIHINCDAKECMYVNFNYIVICDADKMFKYWSVVGCLSNSSCTQVKYWI